MKRITRILSLITPVLFMLLSAPDAWAYYDPGVQRWINRDPAREAGFNACWVRRAGRMPNLGSQSIYRFVGNNPLGKIDYLGLYIPAGIGGPLLKAIKDAKGWCCAKAAGASAWLQTAAAGIDKNDDQYGGNAFTHCLAACQVSKQCGEEGRDAWDGREDPSKPGAAQDLANNQIGYANASAESCWDACMASWNGQELICGNEACPPRDPYAD